jgi:hypothetical protein
MSFGTSGATQEKLIPALTLWEAWWKKSWVGFRKLATKFLGLEKAPIFKCRFGNAKAHGQWN